MMGMKVRICSTLLCNNNYVIVNTQYTYSSLKKNNNSVGFNKYREAAADGFIRNGHIYGNQNSSDVTTNPLVPMDIHRRYLPFLYNKKQENMK